MLTIDDADERLVLLLVLVGASLLVIKIGAQKKRAHLFLFSHANHLQWESSGTNRLSKCRGKSLWPFLVDGIVARKSDDKLPKICRNSSQPTVDLRQIDSVKWWPCKAVLLLFSED